MTVIVSDTSTLYSYDEAKKNKIYISPLHISVDNKSYKEFEEIDSKTLISMIHEKKVPSTSQPSLGDKIDIYNSIDREEDIIDITIAKGLSGTYDSTLIAKQSAEYPERIHVFNSMTLCGPHRMLVDYANNMAKLGEKTSEIISMLEKSVKTEISYLIPRDFQFLLRGGRINAAAANIGGFLKLVPVLKKSKDGTVLEKFCMSRTIKKSIQTIIEDLKAENIDNDYTIYIAHAFAMDTVIIIKELLSKSFPNNLIKIVELSPSFITQGGPGCIAIQTMKICK